MDWSLLFQSYGAVFTNLQVLMMTLIGAMGGVLLGAGGLVRAYSSSAAENLSGADIRCLEVCLELSVTVDYASIDALQKYLLLNSCFVIFSDYGENVCIRLAVKKSDEQVFLAGLVDYLQGRVSVEKGAEYYAAFKICE